jgi:PPOX class probable F420-dependent enzyme
VEEPRALVADARVARLATVGADGGPHLVPIVFALDGDTLYTAVDEKPKRSRRLRRLANVRARPAVSVLVDEYDEDWSRLWWVRLDGRAHVLEGGPASERALELLRSKYVQYRTAPPGGPVIAVEILRWRSWAAAASQVRPNLQSISDASELIERLRTENDHPRPRLGDDWR